MKPLPFLLLSLLLAPASPGAFGQVRKSQTMRDAATHDQLSGALRMAQQKDPVRNLGKPVGKVEEDPSKRVTNRDLIKESTILCYRGYLTLVPKQAVLYQPPQLKERFEAAAKVKVQTWADFYQANRGWIRTLEVSREQAMGQAPMAEDALKVFEGGNAVVVATFKGGPISVLPYTEPEEAGAPLAAKTTEPTPKR